ncbi:hypothetical protein BJ742DRAFT_836041 [Cladochytrium replicatum]|nr:hypothetical protein BJ742DRAFT_836041 [Cladochytrium replicatum]
MNLISLPQELLSKCVLHLSSHFDVLALSATSRIFHTLIASPYVRRAWLTSHHSPIEASQQSQGGRSSSIQAANALRLRLPRTFLYDHLAAYITTRLSKTIPINGSDRYFLEYAWGSAIPRFLWNQLALAYTPIDDPSIGTLPDSPSVELGALTRFLDEFCREDPEAMGRLYVDLAGADDQTPPSDHVPHVDTLFPLGLYSATSFAWLTMIFTMDFWRRFTRTAFFSVAAVRASDLAAIESDSEVIACKTKDFKTAFRALQSHVLSNVVGFGFLDEHGNNIPAWHSMLVEE